MNAPLCIHAGLRGRNSVFFKLHAAALMAKGRDALR
jgi:hypothetical protein